MLYKLCIMTIFDIAIQIINIYMYTELWTKYFRTNFKNPSNYFQLINVLY